MPPQTDKAYFQNQADEILDTMRLLVGGLGVDTIFFDNQTFRAGMRVYLPIVLEAEFERGKSEGSREMLHTVYH